MKALILLFGLLVGAAAASAQTVFDATLAEPDQRTAEVSTAALRQILADNSALLLDARPRREYATGHIPGAVNVAARPGLPAHLYVSDVAEVVRLVDGAHDRPLVLYCNGPFCGKSRRLAAELLDAGFTSVRRYQLGAPGWRALGGVMRTLPEALSYIAGDRTAVWIDAREPEAFRRGSVRRARNIPRSGLRPGKDQGVMREAKDDGRLPMEDHNTRIVVFGADGLDARAVAEAIAGEAFNNVSFVAEPYESLRRAPRRRAD
jgi:rhodanese-related sulfurtransferase